MIYYGFLSGFMFYGFLHALAQAKWSVALLGGLLCIAWLIEAFIEKKKELKQDD